MDDTTKQSLAQPQSDQTQPAVPSQPVSAPSGTGLKEQEPIRQHVPVSEVLRPSDAEPTLHPEVKEAGVKVIEDQIKLSAQDQAAGITHAKESVPVSKHSASIAFPMTEEEENMALRSQAGKRTGNSIGWLALLVRKVRRIINAKEYSQL